jgi:hypothetical protein
MLNVVMLSVIVLVVVMIHVVMLSAIMLGIAILNVLAPSKTLNLKYFFNYFIILNYILFV